MAQAPGGVDDPSNESSAPARPFDLAELLSRADPFLQALVDTIAEGVVVQGADLRVIACNTAAERIIGLSIAEMLARGGAEANWHLMRSDGSRMAPDELPSAVAVRTGEAQRNQIAGLLRRDGTMVWIQLNAIALRSAADEGVYAVVTTFSDVTERHQLEAELHQARRMESIGRLAGGIAHDFNNLLAVMMAAIEEARDSTPPGAPLQEALSAAKESAERARQLTRQLLAFARRQPVLLSELDVNELLRDLARLLKQLLGMCQLDLALEPSIWRVSADPTQLERVLLNLAANARDAMPTGGKLSLTTQNLTLTNSRILPAGRYVAIVAKDTGSGMDEDTLDRLFEPFFTTKADGNGLGLASSYGLVRQLGGDIEVESTRGQGATFRVLLPATQGETK
jgi:two-component system cell cycle sensor histidine kinase/response regulator CckA